MCLQGGVPLFPTLPCCGSSEMAAIRASSAMRVKGDDYVGNKLLLDTGEQGLPIEGAAVLQLDLVVLSSRQYWSQIRSDSVWALWPADSASLAAGLRSFGRETLAVWVSRFHPFSTMNPQLSTVRDLRAALELCPLHLVL